MKQKPYCTARNFTTTYCHHFGSRVIIGHVTDPRWVSYRWQI